MISPILGMMLLELMELELMELFTLLGVAATAGLACVILWTQHKMRDAYGEQLQHQVKLADHQKNLDSTRLVIDLDKVYRTDGFRRVYRLMVNNTIDLGNDEHKEWFVRYINHSEFVCKLFAQELISKSDMAVSYGGLELLLNMNESTREFINKHRYPYLKWYFRYVHAVRRRQS